MITLDFGDRRPLYEQIKEKLKELITSGVLKENDKIPSVRELASSLAINPNTIQKAYRDLETEGYVYSIRAKGSFVSTQNAIRTKEDTDALIDELKRLIDKIRFLGVTDAEIADIVNEELKNKKRGDSDD